MEWSERPRFLVRDHRHWSAPDPGRRIAGRKRLLRGYIDWVIKYRHRGRNRDARMRSPSDLRDECRMRRAFRRVRAGSACDTSAECGVRPPRSPVPRFDADCRRDRSSTVSVTAASIASLVFSRAARHVQQESSTSHGMTSLWSPGLMAKRQLVGFQSTNKSSESTNRKCCRCDVLRILGLFRPPQGKL